MPKVANRKISKQVEYHSEEDIETSDVPESYEESDNEESDNESDNGEFKGEYSEDDIRNIIFSDIDDTYAYSKLGEFDVMIMKSNGYINASKLCTDSNKKLNKKDKKKELSNWINTDKSRKIISMFRKKINTEPIIKVMTGKNLTRGSYVHPYLITHISCWLSTHFLVETCTWVEEWKNFDSKNYVKYWETVYTSPVDFSLQKEKEIQSILKKKFHGKIEVQTDNGFIDLLTKNKIIEIKHSSEWKSALGQILAYSLYYPDKEKVIYLFDVNENCNLKNIKKTCKIYDVKIEVYDY